MPLNLDRILATPVTGDTVGAPPDARTTIGEVGAQGWTLDDLSPPTVTLRRSAIEHNLALMARYCADHDVDLFPHGKTTMAPQLWESQLAMGASGLTAATPAQVRAMRSVGVERILLANELTDRPSLSWLAHEHEDTRSGLTCWVDSADGVHLLQHGVASGAEPLRVLVELGHVGGRTGARSVEGAIQVAEAVASSQDLTLAGVAGYEGTIGQERSAGVIADVDRFLDRMRDVVDRLLSTGLLDGTATVSAGGSLFFDRVVARLSTGWPAGATVRVALRSGCTITHDHGLYERGSPFADAAERFVPAFEAWGSVLSRPEPDVVIIGLGKRDVPTDIEPPIPLQVRGDERSLDGMEVLRMMDQHAICRIPPAVALEPGELVGFGISHPCAAFDRRRVLFVLDDDDRVVDAIGTLF